MSRKQIPSEALIDLRRRLEMLPKRCPERRILAEETAKLYGVSIDTLYRALRSPVRPKALHRSDRGAPRKLDQASMERYCEVIAAFKIRTCNKKGRHVSTERAIELLEEFGMETGGGAPPAPHQMALSNHPRAYWQNQRLIVTSKLGDTTTKVWRDNHQRSAFRRLTVMNAGILI